MFRHGYAHLGPQSSFIHISCDIITPIFRGFHNTVCAACLIANESSRMAVYRTCVF